MPGSCIEAEQESSGKGWEDCEKEDLSAVVFGNQPQKQEGLCVLEESSGASKQEERGYGII